MALSIRGRAHALIAAGLIGMALYAILVRTALPAILSSDTAHGIWVGACFGLEILGLRLLLSSRRNAR